MKSFPMYVPLSGHLFLVKRNNVSTFTTANNTNYTNLTMSTYLTQTTYKRLQLELHKPPHEYAFYLDHIGTPSTRPTNNLQYFKTKLRT